MINKEIIDIYNSILDQFNLNTYPFSAQNIVAFDFLDDYLKSYFANEINFFCDKLLASVVKQTCINDEILKHEDADQLKQILLDWVQFDETNVQNVLKSAISLRLNYIFSPVEAIVSFIFSDKKNMPLKDVLMSLNFMGDDDIMKDLQERIFDLQNDTIEIEVEDFTDLLKDVIFKFSQNKTIDDFLLPLRTYSEISQNNSINMNLISLFFSNKDLTGILSEVQRTAEEANVESYTCDELADLLKELLDNTEPAVSVATDEHDIYSQMEMEDNDEFIAFASTMEGADNEVEIPDTEFDIFDDDTLIIPAETLESDFLEISSKEEINDEFVHGEVFDTVEITEADIDDFSEEINEIIEENIDNIAANDEYDLMYEVIDEADINDELAENIDMNEEDILAENENIEIDIDNSDMGVEAVDFFQKATEIHEKTISYLDKMREEKHPSIEIELKYFELEKQNINDFREKALS